MFCEAQGELRNALKRGRARETLTEYVKNQHAEPEHMLKPPALILRGGFIAAVVLCAAALQGCAVVAVVDTVGTVAVKTVGLAANAAVGAVKITGRAVGAVADTFIPGSN